MFICWKSVADYRRNSVKMCCQCMQMEPIKGIGNPSGHMKKSIINHMYDSLNVQSANKNSVHVTLIHKYMKITIQERS